MSEHVTHVCLRCGRRFGGSAGWSLRKLLRHWRTECRP